MRLRSSIVPDSRVPVDMMRLVWTLEFQLQLQSHESVQYVHTRQSEICSDFECIDEIRSLISINILK